MRSANGVAEGRGSSLEGDTETVSASAPLQVFHVVLSYVELKQQSGPVQDRRPLVSFRVLSPTFQNVDVF
jgi:hypothetical protein